MENKKILILCKTYPSPSAQFAETSCVAGMFDTGELVRIYPFPFRLVEDSMKFKKWQWVECQVAKATKDHRPESYKINIDSVKTLGDPIPTNGNWKKRLELIDHIKPKMNLDDVKADQLAAKQAGVKNPYSLFFLKPSKLIELVIRKEKNPQWEKEELDKLLQANAELDLFGKLNNDIRTLRKLPYSFYYKYECEGSDEIVTHKINDWEAGAAYWQFLKLYGEHGWEEKFRLKFEREFSSKDLLFLMGNQHRFQNQWMIISLIYPKKPDHAAML